MVEPLTDDLIEDWRSNLSRCRLFDLTHHIQARIVMTITATPNTPAAIEMTAMYTDEPGGVMYGSEIKEKISKSLTYMYKRMEKEFLFSNQREYHC